MSTEALRKAVESACHYLSIERSGNVEFVRLSKSDWATIEQALRDQGAALATHRANYDALVIRLGEVTARLEAADGLLRECRQFAAWASERLPEAMPTYEKIDTHLKAADHV